MNFYKVPKIQLKKILEKKKNNLKLLNIFVTKKNINQILKKYSGKEIDLLSIDIDGNDFWIWKAINCVKPRLVVIEYNSFFGPNISATIKYNPKFSWDHYNNKSYYGASLKALEKLGKLNPAFDKKSCKNREAHDYFYRHVHGFGNR